MTMTRKQAALYGALIGDALGVPFEFRQPALIPAKEQISLHELPAGYVRSHPSAALGAWSDDGAQLLCLAETLLAGHGMLDLDGFGQRLLDWRYRGRHQHEHVVFDCGGTTRQALERLRTGTPAALSGGQDARSNGNGSLMRCLPAALYAQDVIECAVMQSLPTHRHALSRACCAVYAAVAQGLLQEPSTTVQDLFEQAFLQVGQHQASSELAHALSQIQRWPAQNMPTGTGFVVDTLWSAAWALERADDYVSAVRLAVSLGHDTDTTACVTGGLAALRWGLGSVPDAWWTALRIPSESQDVLQRAS